MKFIKHKNMTDVVFQVHETQKDLFRRWEEVRGLWWNIALGEEAFPMGSGNRLAIETITIKDPENWEEFNDVRSAKASFKSR